MTLRTVSSKVNNLFKILSEKHSAIGSHYGVQLHQELASDSSTALCPLPVYQQKNEFQFSDLSFLMLFHHSLTYTNISLMDIKRVDFFVPFSTPKLRFPCLIAFDPTNSRLDPHFLS